MMLSHIRVLELADGLTDLGGRMLAELGAQVMVAGTGDMPADQAAAWHHGKTRITAGAGDIRRLAASADIVLDGRRLGGEWDDLLSLNPRLIHVVVWSALPGTPSHGRPATDLTLMAQSGLMQVVGEPDRPPLRLPGQQAYALTGIQAATAALLGLAARHRTGAGQRIDLSAQQSATLANYREAIVYDWTGRIGRRPGNLLVRGKSGVRQVWPCADGFVTWSMVDNPGMMRALVAVMKDHGAAGELADIDWQAILVADTDQTVLDRWQGIVGDFFGRHTKAQLGDWSLKHGWGLSPIFDSAEVLESAHLAHRGLFVTVDTPDGPRRLPGPLFQHGAGDGAPERRLSDVVPAAKADWGAS